MNVFITGTDTGSGKSFICRLLAAYLSNQGMNVITQKWVQTGNAQDDDIQMHGVVLRQEHQASASLAQLRTVYSLKYPASPHFAAALEQVRIEPTKIMEAYGTLARMFDAVVVEGSGGILVPLDQELLLADVVAQLMLPVVIVIRNALGAINHALLTVEALRARGIDVTGLIFNRTNSGGDEQLLRENIRIIKQISGVPVFGEQPFCLNEVEAKQYFEPIGQAVCNYWKDTRT